MFSVVIGLLFSGILLFFCLISDYPRGWVYLPSIGKYYRAVFESVNWTTAASRCSALGSRSRLVDINSAHESQAVQTLIASFDSNVTNHLQILSEIFYNRLNY